MLFTSAYLGWVVKHSRSCTSQCEMKSSIISDARKGLVSSLKTISSYSADVQTSRQSAIPSSEISESTNVPLTKKITPNNAPKLPFMLKFALYMKQKRSLDSYKRILVLKSELLQDVEVVAYTPQSFTSFKIFSTLETHLRNKLSDAAISKIEGLMALYLALSDVQSATGFAAVLTLYAKTHNQVALTTQLKDITQKLFDTYKPQSSDARPKWLEDMVSGLSNWKLLVNSPSFAQISRVLSLLITLGVIDSCSLNLGNFEIFAIQAQAKHCNAIDLIDACIETVTYFAEGAYQCFEKGSLKPLLFSSSRITQIEEKYIEKQTEWEFVRCGNLEKFGTKTEAQFDKELSELVDELHELFKVMPNGAEKKIVQVKWERLAKMQAEFIALRVAGGLRKSPYCVKIFGQTSVGKSTFADLTMSAVLKASGAPCTSEYIVTLNEKEKFMSTYKSFVTGIKLDDYGNSKAEFWECAPSDWILKICNNIREAAVMADISNKGKISIEPSCLTITTNVEGLHAGVTSNNPMSILRRAHTHVEVIVKEEFATDGMLDTKKVIKKFGDLSKIHDVWLINLKKPVADPRNKTAFSSWQTIATGLDISQYLNYILAEAKEHDHFQGIITDGFSEPSDLVIVCGECNKLTSTCECVVDLEPQFGERLAAVIASKASETHLDFRKLKCKTEIKVEDLAVDTLLEGFKFFEESPYSHWTSWVPESFMDNDYVRAAILTAGKDIIGQSVKEYCYSLAAASLATTGVAASISRKLIVPTAVCCGVWSALCSAGIIEAKKNAYLEQLVETRGALNSTFISARDKHVQYACGAFAGLSLLYSAAKLVQALRASLTIQGSLNPSSIEDIQNRDKQTNPWKEVAPTLETDAPINHPTKVHTENCIQKSIAQITIGDKISGAFMLKTNVIAIPHHFLPKSTQEACIMYCSRTIRFILNPTLTQRVGDTDLALVYVPNTGPLKDNTIRFSTNYPRQPLLCTMFGLKNNHTPFKSSIMWQFCPGVNNGYCVFNGSHYDMVGMDTFNGQCMSPVVADAQRQTILGFHIGGKEGTVRGCGMAISRPELTVALSQLNNLSNSFILGPQAVDIEDVVANRKIAISPNVHHKCPSNFIETTGSVEIYGSVTGRTTMKSMVIPTPISDIVEEVTGVPNTWGPPRFTTPKTLPNGVEIKESWQPWFASLDVCSQPSIGFDPAAVDVATSDYLGELKQCFDNQFSLWRTQMRPLNDVEIVSGIDGVRFIDAMKSSTSMGYPINGPKTNYLVDLPPTEENACPRTFTQEIWDLVQELEERADDGTFLNQIFGASLKDEPTPLDKEKVRVFQAAPIALQILIRKYFLSIARFLSANPLIAESAVGINAHGPDWHELAEFMAQFGEDRVVGGDYSKYDLRMPEQLTLAAFSIMIKIAQWSGNFTQQDVKRMEVIAHDVCNPLVAYNGTLMRFMGTNPSGQNMTVYINGIVNSLLHRLAFNDAYPTEERIKIGKELGLNRPATFRDMVCLSTYGDDAKGSVRTGYDKFNHCQMAAFLAANDMKFTMPDKTSDPVPFMSRFDCDFLKRKDRFDSELGVYVGMLDQASIFKSLHSIIRSKVVTPEQVSVMNLAGASREFFYHGRDVYEMRQQQLLDIATKSGLPAIDLNISYDQRVIDWREKYHYTPQSGTINFTLNYKKIDFYSLEAFEGMSRRKINATRIMVNESIAEQGDALSGFDETIRKLMSLNRHDTSEIVMKVRDHFFPPTIDTISVLTEPPQYPKSVVLEDTLLDSTELILGTPTARNFTLGLMQLGEIDLLYLRDGVALVIECKRVVGRASHHKQDVIDQATKYANTIKTLRPDLTVYGITCTEYGYCVVECLGEPLFPSFCANFLDNVAVKPY